MKTTCAAGLAFCWSLQKHSAVLGLALELRSHSLYECLCAHLPKMVTRTQTCTNGQGTHPLAYFKSPSPRFHHSPATPSSYEPMSGLILCRHQSTYTLATPQSPSADGQL